MVSMNSGHLRLPAIKMKFICVSAPVEVGSLIDGWRVGWWCSTYGSKLGARKWLGAM